MIRATKPKPFVGVLQLDLMAQSIADLHRMVDALADMLVAVLQAAEEEASRQGKTVEPAGVLTAMKALAEARS